jgi:putative hydrolase of HD superfamily
MAIGFGLVKRYQELEGPYDPRPTETEIEQIFARLRETLTARQVTDPWRNLVIANRATDELFGRVSWYWQSEETQWLGGSICLFDPAIWGQGIGYEALGLWSEYLFAVMPRLPRLDLRTWSGNHGMMRLAEKLGYRLEARLRKARMVHDHSYDGMGYGILREEWLARSPHGFATSLQAS